jgi:hypothetical protein
VNWHDDAHRVPSQNRPLLESILGTRLLRLSHYLEDPLEHLLQDESYISRGVTHAQLFSFAGGPVIATMDGDRQVCISHSSELLSVTIEAGLGPIARSTWDGPIEASDPVYAEPRFARLVGATVTAIHTLQLDIDIQHLEFATSHGKRVFSPRVLERPREAALIFTLDTRAQLVFSTTLIASPTDFSISTEIPECGVPYREILRVP